MPADVEPEVPTREGLKSEPALDSAALEAAAAKAEAAAEKAYAAAAEKIPAAAAPVSAPKRVKVVAPAPKPIAAEPKTLAAPKPVGRPRGRPRKDAAAKPTVAPTPVKAAAPKPAPVRKPRALPNAKPAKAAVPIAKTTRPKPVLSQLKETIMATTTPDFTVIFKDFQDKAKVAYDKSTAVFGEAAEFTKGNVEAVVESGKILAGGFQALGTTAVAESRSAFEALTSDVKSLAAVKSPAEFIKLQSEMVRRNFDQAVAFSSKQSEAVLKLASEAAAPIGNRVSLAVEKVRSAA
ncbi:MAG: phasin family protein [Novosphingobium sp.]|nr:phasin family protein [Novosphingobium sp.]